MRQNFERSVKIPRLVGVDHQRPLRSDQPPQGLQVRKVDLRAEADLQLEGAIAFIEFAARERLRALGIDPARIDANCGPTLSRGVTREHAPQRQARMLRRQIPERDVDARDRLGERPCLAALQRENARRFSQATPFGRWIDDFSAGQKWCQHCFDEPSAMLRPASRKVAPHLSPADGAIGVSNAHHDGWTIVHNAE